MKYENQCIARKLLLCQQPTELSLANMIFNVQYTNFYYVNSILYCHLRNVRFTVKHGTVTMYLHTYLHLSTEPIHSLNELHMYLIQPRSSYPLSSTDNIHCKHINPKQC